MAINSFKSDFELTVLKDSIRGAKTKLYDLYIRHYCFNTETISGVYVGTHKAPSFEAAKKKQLTIMKKAVKTGSDSPTKVYANTYPFYSSLEEATNVR